MDRQDLTFDSHGTPIAAYVYRPIGTGPAPCIVMAHGFSATRDQALPHYAERFVSEGYAVVLFDYRHFGASGGEPRQLLDIKKQHQDWVSAIAYARGLDFVDPARIVLWGSSFSGGHVVAVGAKDPNVKAVLAQVPYGDGLATVLSFPLLSNLKITGLALLDQLGSLVGRKPVMVTVAAKPGELAVLTDAEALPGFLSIDPPDSLWRNEFGAKLFLRIPFYRPVTAARKLQAPLLISVADNDKTVPPNAAVKMGEVAPRGEVVRYPIGHFDVYTGPEFEIAIVDQISFLKEHVPA
jgi:pimeloyl-ACP methyl ester carboxylesterase